MLTRRGGGGRGGMGRNMENKRKGLGLVVVVPFFPDKRHVKHESLTTERYTHLPQVQFRYVRSEGQSQKTWTS